MTDRFIEIAAIARRYGVTTATVRNWIRSGKLPAERTPSGRYRVRASALIKEKETKEPKSQDATS